MNCEDEIGLDGLWRLFLLDSGLRPECEKAYSGRQVRFVLYRYWATRLRAKTLMCKNFEEILKMLKKDDLPYTALKTHFDQLSKHDWSSLHLSMSNESSNESKLTIHRLQEEWELLKPIISELLKSPDKVENIYPGLVYSLSANVKTLFTHLSTVSNPPTQPQQYMNQIDTYLKQIAASTNALGLNIYFGLLKDVDDVAANLKDARAFINEAQESKAQIEQYKKETDAIKKDLQIIALTKDFNSRKHSVGKAAGVYAWLLIVVTFLLIGYSIYTATHLEGNDNQLVLTIKILSIVPFACLITFLWRSYSRERHFEEEYAFRETLSGCLPEILSILVFEG